MRSTDAQLPLLPPTNEAVKLGPGGAAHAIEKVSGDDAECRTQNEVLRLALAGEAAVIGPAGHESLLTGPERKRAANLLLALIEGEKSAGAKGTSRSEMPQI
jgi:hypothetical protein